MGPTPNQLPDRTIFNAIPMPAFIVDSDVQILDLNDAASQFCGQSLNLVYKHRGGEVLGCLHSTDAAEGCGRGPECQGCVIRNSVGLSLQGQSISHRVVNLRLSHGMEVTELQVLLTASPLPEGVEKRALLIIESIPGISEFRTVVPICMKCKKVHSKEQDWVEVDAFFHEHAGVFFAHGLCPPCASRFSGAS